jgi:hypothetical protein
MVPGIFIFANSMLFSSLRSVMSMTYYFFLDHSFNIHLVIQIFVQFKRSYNYIFIFSIPLIPKKSYSSPSLLAE